MEFFYTICYISQIAIFDWTLSTSDHTALSTELSVKDREWERERKKLGGGDLRI
jgi:hypothetical protein